MKQYSNNSQPTFPKEDCGCEACIGERENQKHISKIVFDQEKLDQLKKSTFKVDVKSENDGPKPCCEYGNLGEEHNCLYERGYPKPYPQNDQS